MDEFDDVLRAGANDEWGLAIGAPVLAQLRRYAEILLEWNNTRFNLTAITEPREVAAKHFLDSLSVLKAHPIAIGATVIDIGTGAGLPGIALSIVRPDLRMTLLDSTAKKVAFCQFVVSELGLPRVNTVHARAEDAARDPAYAKQFAIVVSRAVASLDRLLGWCAPFVSPSGAIIALKGPGAPREIADAHAVARALRLNVQALPIHIPFEADRMTRYAVVARRGGLVRHKSSA